MGVILGELSWVVRNCELNSIPLLLSLLALPRGWKFLYRDSHVPFHTPHKTTLPTWTHTSASASTIVSTTHMAPRTGLPPVCVKASLATANCTIHLPDFLLGGSAIAQLVMLLALLLAVCQSIGPVPRQSQRLLQAWSPC